MRETDAERVDAVRGFYRFMTGHVGALEESLLGSGFTLAEARLLYELDRQPRIAATDLASRLRLDPAYLSRLMKRFRQKGLVHMEVSPEDKRRQLLSLSAAGERAFAPVEAGSRRRVAEVLALLTEAEQDRLLAAMAAIVSLLDPGAGSTAPTVIREARRGESGRVLQAAVSLFGREFSWLGRFEAELADRLAGYLSRSPSPREALLLVERAGILQGAALLIEAEGEALIPLLFLEQEARGLGLGRALLAQMLAQAEAAGHRRLKLCSAVGLEAAEGLLRQVGFRLDAEVSSRDYGLPLTRQTWARNL